MRTIILFIAILIASLLVSANLFVQDANKNIQKTGSGFNDENCHIATYQKK